MGSMYLIYVILGTYILNLSDTVALRRFNLIDQENQMAIPIESRRDLSLFVC